MYIYDDWCVISIVQCHNMFYNLSYNVLLEATVRLMMFLRRVFPVFWTIRVSTQPPHAVFALSSLETTLKNWRNLESPWDLLPGNRLGLMLSCNKVGVSKNSGKTPKMDGENHGKPYEQMDDSGWFYHPTPIFWRATQVQTPWWTPCLPENPHQPKDSCEATNSKVLSIASVEGLPLQTSNGCSRICCRRRLKKETSNSWNGKNMKTARHFFLEAKMNPNSIRFEITAYSRTYSKKQILQVMHSKARSWSNCRFERSKSCHQYRNVIIIWVALQK